MMRTDQQRQRHRVYMRKWRAADPDRTREARRKYRAGRRARDPEFRAREARYLKEYHRRPEVQERIRERQRRQLERPAVLGSSSDKLPRGLEKVITDHEMEFSDDAERLTQDFLFRLIIRGHHDL